MLKQKNLKVCRKTS